MSPSVPLATVRRWVCDNLGSLLRSRSVLLSPIPEGLFIWLLFPCGGFQSLVVGSRTIFF